MGILLKGAETAAALTAKTKEQALILREKGIVPNLAIVRVGEREDDIAYERSAVKRCGQAEVAVKQFVLPQKASQTELIDLIRSLNDDASVHGVLLMCPLPPQFDDVAVRRELSSEKDVDGITDGSMAGVFSGSKQGFAPCTAQACIELLKHNHVAMTGKRAVVVGRSLVIGKPVAMLLMAENMTVTVCHTKTEDLNSVCREADILVVAAGKAGVLGAESVKAGQVVLDVGIHIDEENKLCGDVRTQEVAPVVGAITPVPGGVGAVTTSVLAAHVVTAAQHMLEEDL